MSKPSVNSDVYRVAGAFVSLMVAGFILDYIVFVVFEACAMIVAIFLAARPGDKKAFLRMQLNYVTIWSALLILAKSYAVYSVMNGSGRVGGVEVSKHFAYALSASASDLIRWGLGILPLAVGMDVVKTWLQHSRDSDNERSLEQIAQRQNRNKF